MGAAFPAARMGRMILGAARGGVALALSLALFGCSRPLATPELPQTSGSRSVLERSATGRRPVLERSEKAAVQSRSGRVVALARAQLGRPYVWGGATEAGFDCSGLVMYVYARVGVTLPHSAAKQYRYGAPVMQEGLEPGDVVFFARLHHNGIYIGDGRFIHARRSGGGVMVSGLRESWYRARWVGARRFLRPAEAASTTTRL